jgi:hypothetical protein
MTSPAARVDYLLDFGVLSPRKMRLVAVAFWRVAFSLRNRIRPDLCLRIAAQAERMADGLPLSDRLESCYPPLHPSPERAMRLIALRRDDSEGDIFDREVAAQLRVLDCLIGEPARYGKISRAPHPATLAMAYQVYQHRLPGGVLDNFGLTLLADRLEEEGVLPSACNRCFGSGKAQSVAFNLDGECSFCLGAGDDGLLAHLHDSGFHFSGCRAIDTIIGKS